MRIGNKTATFLFDTGCSNTILFDAQESGIVPDGWGEALDSNGNLEKVSFCKIPEIQIGNTVIRRASAAIAPNDRLAAMESRVAKVKGGIGADLMAGGRAIKIDVKAKHIILTDKPKIFAGEKRHTTTFKEACQLCLPRHRTVWRHLNSQYHFRYGRHEISPRTRI